MQQDLSKLSLTALRNLFFEETRIFLAALDSETAEALQTRRERIRAIDKAIDEKKKSTLKQTSLF